jgi:UDP-GlcNAc:undecaprenyl-phosphate GlcNAc-1-phosphate transferase
MDLKELAFVFMAALFSAILMVPMLRHWALDRGEVDVPDERKIHQRAVPRIGGIAICLAFLFSILVFVDITREIRGILAGTLIIFVTGLVDDLHGISARGKFLGEIAACLVTITTGRLWIVNLGNFSGNSAIPLPLWLAIPITLTAVVGVINALNLIDGLDGLAGGVSVIALCAFLVLAGRDANPQAAVLGVGLLGAILGFLKYNFYPARIFMGDTGSLTIGFVLSFLAIMLTQLPGTTITPAVPVLILGVPILDTLWVMGRRMTRGHCPFAPDKTHIHHKFLDLGFQHRFTVLIIYTISLFWAFIAILFHDAPVFWLLSVFIGCSVPAYLAMRYVLNHRERFGFLSFDSSRGIRDSRTYQRAASTIAALSPAILVLAWLFILATGFFASRGEAGLWQVSAVIFLGGLGLLYHTRDPRNEFLLAMLFVGVLVITFVAQLNEANTVFGELTLRGLSRIIFPPLTLLLALRLIFLKREEFFLTPVDFLILGMAVSFILFFPQIGFKINFLGALGLALSKGIILFFALKVAANRGRRSAGLAVGSLLAVLMVISLRNFVG